MPKSNYDISKLEVYRLFIGAVLFVFLIIIHVFFKEIPIWLIAIPGFLMGIDFKEIINLKK